MAVLSLSPFYRWETGTYGLGDLPKAMKLVSGESGFKLNLSGHLSLVIKKILRMHFI